MDWQILPSKTLPELIVCYHKQRLPQKASWNAIDNLCEKTNSIVFVMHWPECIKNDVDRLNFMKGMVYSCCKYSIGPISAGLRSK